VLTHFYVSLYPCQVRETESKHSPVLSNGICSLVGRTWLFERAVVFVAELDIGE